MDHTGLTDKVNNGSLHGISLQASLCPNGGQNQWVKYCSCFAHTACYCGTEQFPKSAAPSIEKMQHSGQF